MSIEPLIQLEAKIQSAIETIGFQRLEIEELQEEKDKLEKENNELRAKLQNWSDQVGSLLGRLETAETEEG